MSNPGSAGLQTRAAPYSPHHGTRPDTYPTFPHSTSVNKSFPLLLSLVPVICSAQTDPAPEIETLLPGVTLTLVAEHPDIATPTGIDVDVDGNIWAVACHTHMPPDDYAGPKFDEILVFSPDGKTRSVFYNATFHTMDLELGSDGWVYLAERDRIFRIRDTDGDGRADVEEDLATMETESDYPHNGLAGLAWHPDGDLVFGLGENFAKPWTMTSADGVVLTGKGEGGVFRCRPDGTGLRRVALGMWNPFGVCVRSDGEIFASDNDPGERPPCRLLHIVEGGDYGYQRKYGGEAHHPFVGWNGELRGTLPMLHSSGEAPCGLLPLGNGLLVPSWSDHRIDFYPLTRESASYTTRRLTLLRGSSFFRPVCIAEDKRHADTRKRTWYLTDWVDGRYPVHGFGRLWKLDLDLDAADWIGELELEPPTAEATLAHSLRRGESDGDEPRLFELAGHADPFISRAALVRLADAASEWMPGKVSSRPETDRVHAAIALKLAQADADTWIPALLDDPSPRVQFEALRWISDAELKQRLPDVENILARSELTFEVFEAAVAAWNTLSGLSEQGIRNPEKLLARVLDADSSPRLRAFALRLLPTPALVAAASDPHARIRLPKELTVETLESLLAVEDPELSGEVVRLLSGAPNLGKQLLPGVATDADRPGDIRAEAVAGLAPSTGEHGDLLLSLIGDSSDEVREEALRALRGRPLTDAQKASLTEQATRFPESSDLFTALLDPASLGAGRPGLDAVDAWLARIDSLPSEANPAAGGRIFHHYAVALCANCHRHDGRGNVVGPDLTNVGARAGADRRWLLESLLQPNLEVAPEFQARTVTLKDGSIHTGIRLRSWTKEQLRDAAGRTLTFETSEVASIRELDASLMPPGLVYTLTDRELRDLMTFLETEP